MRDDEAIEHLLVVIRRVSAGHLEKRFGQTALHGLEGIARRRLVDLPPRQWNRATRAFYESAGVAVPDWDLSNLNDAFALVAQLAPKYRQVMMKEVVQSQQERMILLYCAAFRA